MATPFDTLGPDLLGAIARAVPAGDAFAFASASRACHAAVREAWSRGTRTGFGAASPALLAWKVACGMPRWNKWTCAEAAKGGHLGVLQWARANGCPWDVWTCAYAAKGGHLDVLQWARANGCPWDESTCSEAA